MPDPARPARPYDQEIRPFTRGDQGPCRRGFAECGIDYHRGLERSGCRDRRFEDQVFTSEDFGAEEIHDLVPEHIDVDYFEDG